MNRAPTSSTLFVKLIKRWKSRSFLQEFFGKRDEIIMGSFRFNRSKVRNFSSKVFHSNRQTGRGGRIDTARASPAEDREFDSLSSQTMT